MSPLTTSQSRQHGKSAPTINDLPNEILVEIYHCLANLQQPVSLPIEINDDIDSSELQYNVRQYSDLILTKNHAALTLRLVSRRFNFLFKNFTVRNIVLVQNRLLLLEATVGRRTELRSRRQFEDANELAESMERQLCNMTSLTPGLGQHCKSLCLAYRRVTVPGVLSDHEGYVMSDGLFGALGADDGQFDNQDVDLESLEFELQDMTIPTTSWLSNFYSNLSHVIDVQVHSNHFRSFPDITPALSSFHNLTTLRATGQINYESFFRQLLSTLTPSSALQTLDMSDAPGKWPSLGLREIIEKLTDVSGTAPFTRLLTGADTDPDLLAAIVAWPRRLERLALQTSPEQMTISQPGKGSVQHILDTQKNSLTHLRFEGEYEPGLLGFDLRGFPCLEHLALSSDTISNLSWLERREDDALPDPEEHILAPRLRSLLLVMPPEQFEDGDSLDFKEQEDEVQRIMTMVSEELLEGQEARKERSLKRIWLQTLTEPLENLPADEKEIFATHLRSLAWIDDIWGEPDGPLLQHVPLPKGGMGNDASRRRPFPPLDEVWSWDDDSGPGELLLEARRQRAARLRVYL